MFELIYRIVPNINDDYYGQNGFLLIKCNGFEYGEMYPEDIEHIFNRICLCDWFDRLKKVAAELEKRNYAALSDVDSYNRWIEFRRNGERLLISIVKADKPEGSREIEFKLSNAQNGEWSDQEVDFSQFKAEVNSKAEEYYNLCQVKSS